MVFGSLHTLRKYNLLVCEDTIAQFIVECLNGLSFMAVKNLIHSDLKPENILISLNFHIKISDFGNADPKNGSPASDYLGTYEYCAPEVFFTRQYNPLHLRPLPKGDFNLDTWSLGISFFEIISHRLPWWMPKKRKRREAGKACCYLGTHLNLRTRLSGNPLGQLPSIVRSEGIH